VSLVLTGGTVVRSLDPPTISSTDVVLNGERVGALGPSGAAGAPRIDCSGCLVIPGNVCSHHHLYSALARGMSYRLDPPETFLQILQRIWWRLDRALEPEDVSLSAWAAGADALLAGTTTVVDHHASPNAIEGSLDRIASALGDLGLRSVLCYEVSDRDGPERAEAGIEENRRFLKRDDPLVRGMVGAHASFTLSEETLAEDGTDQRDARARFGTRVIHRLAEAGALDARAILAHCVHVDEREAARIHETGATVAHNARSNMNNRVGRAPIAGLGERLALGTDGIDGDLFAESRAAYWRAREADASIQPDWATRRVAAGAKLAGRLFGEPLLGRIEPQAPADLVVLAYDPPTPVSEGNIAGHWVFGISAANVRDVIVNGEVVVRDRRLTRGDRPDLPGRCREAAGSLWRRMEQLPAHPFAPVGAP
jgi:putative selenium metabolism protein SsnA